MQCETFRSQLQPYLAEELDGDLRTAWRDHLRDCVECREWALVEEPTLLFASLPAHAPDSRRVDSCADAVVALIRHERLEKRLRGGRASYLATAAALLLLTLAGLIWRLLPQRLATVPGSLARPTVATVEPRGTDLPPPMVEVDMPGKDVRIYRFATADDGDTAVLFIVNPALES